MKAAADQFWREAISQPPCGYDEDEWAEVKRQTDAAVRGETPDPPPIRIHLPDGRLCYTLQRIDGEWLRIEPPGPPVELPKEPPESGDVVYFIGGADGPIKIGVAVNPIIRLNTLQTGNPAKLSILATVRGGMRQERIYHKQFAATRLQGEWFERTPELLAEIEWLSPL